MKNSIYIIFFLVLTSFLYSLPQEKEILSIIQEYVKINNPNIIDDMLPHELDEVRSFNVRYQEISNALGKEEVFYFMKLSDSSEKTNFSYSSFVLHVPIKYIEYFDEYDNQEKDMIGQFIWKHKQTGDLDIEHLRKVNLPQVVEYLEAQFREEGGTYTGRGYKIRKILDELQTLSVSGSPFSDDSEANATLAVNESSSKIKSANINTTKPAEEPIEKSSNWWLWLIGAVVVIGGVLIFRLKSNDRSNWEFYRPAVQGGRGMDRQKWGQQSEQSWNSIFVCK